MKFSKLLSILGLALFAMGANAQNILSFEPVEAAVDDEIGVSLLLDNEVPVTAINFDIILPAQLEFAEVMPTSRTRIKATDKWTFTVDDSNDGVIRVAGYAGKSELAVGTGAIATFTFVALDDFSGEICMNNALTAGANPMETKFLIGKISSCGYSTYSSVGDISLNMVISGATPYYGKVSGDVLALSEVPDAKLLAGEGVVLKGTSGASVYATTTHETIETPDNDLVGTGSGVNVSTQNVHVLSVEDGVVGFYKYTGDWIVNGKAYLSGVAPARVLFDTELAIESVAAENNVRAIYNLQGQKLSEAKKGINIVNGKKVMY